MEPLLQRNVDTLGATYLVVSLIVLIAILVMCTIGAVSATKMFYAAMPRPIRPELINQHCAMPAPPNIDIVVEGDRRPPATLCQHNLELLSGGKPKKTVNFSDRLKSTGGQALRAVASALPNKLTPVVVKDALCAAESFDRISVEVKADEILQIILGLIGHDSSERMPELSDACKFLLVREGLSFQALSKINALTPEVECKRSIECRSKMLVVTTPTMSEDLSRKIKKKKSRRKRAKESSETTLKESNTISTNTKNKETSGANTSQSTLSGKNHRRKKHHYKQQHKNSDSDQYSKEHNVFLNSLESEGEENNKKHRNLETNQSFFSPIVDSTKTTKTTVTTDKSSTTANIDSDVGDRFDDDSFKEYKDKNKGDNISSPYALSSSVKNSSVNYSSGYEKTDENTKENSYVSPSSTTLATASSNQSPFAKEQLTTRTTTSTTITTTSSEDEDELKELSSMKSISSATTNSPYDCSRYEVEGHADKNGNFMVEISKRFNSNDIYEKDENASGDCNFCERFRDFSPRSALYSSAQTPVSSVTAPFRSSSLTANETKKSMISLSPISITLDFNGRQPASTSSSTHYRTNGSNSISDCDSNYYNAHGHTNRHEHYSSSLTYEDSRRKGDNERNVIAGSFVGKRDLRLKKHLPNFRPDFSYM